MTNTKLNFLKEIKGFSNAIDGYSKSVDYINKTLSSGDNITGFYNTKINQLNDKVENLQNNVSVAVEKNNNLIDKLNLAKQNQVAQAGSVNNKYAGSGGNFDMQYAIKSQLENQTNELKQQNDDLEQQKQEELKKLKREKNQLELAKHSASFDVFKQKALGIIRLF
jgi:hypothetical protein